MAEVLTPIRVDALTPAEMAGRCESVGVSKARLDFWTLLGLSVLAGSFIALGGVFMTTVTTGASALPFGLAKLAGGLVFCLGLILVVVAGAELFTGNNLIIMAFMNRKVTLAQLLRNWGIVYLGNLGGALAMAVLVFLSRQYTAGSGAVGANALAIANAKSGLEFGPALALGILCNALVCLAVWLCYSARTTSDKILAIIFPITAFVAAGFEHSIANMYLIPLGLLIKTFDPGFVAGLQAAGTTGALEHLTFANMWLRNLLPVTLGNIIGGAGLVGLVYWFLYLRKEREANVCAAPGDRVEHSRPPLRQEVTAYRR
ncbi:MAG: formate/nitrite transporter family protein [Anaerolineae bacterium]